MKFSSFLPVVALLCLCGVGNAEILGFNITAFIENAIKQIVVELSRIFWNDWPVSRPMMEAAGIVEQLKIKYKLEFEKLPQPPPTIDKLRTQAFDNNAATFGGIFGDAGNGADGFLTLILLRLLGFQAIGVLGRGYNDSELPAKFAKDVFRVLGDAKIIDFKAMAVDVKLQLAAELEKIYKDKEQFDTDIKNLLDNPPQILTKHYVQAAGSDTATVVADFINNPTDNTNPIFTAVEDHKARERQAAMISNYIKLLVVAAESIGVKIVKPTGDDSSDLRNAKLEMGNVKNMIALLDAVAGKGSGGAKIIEKAKVVLSVGKEYENHKVKRSDGNTPTDVVAIDMRSFEDHTDQDSLKFVVTPNVVITINGFRLNIPSVVLNQANIEYYHVIPEPVYTQAIAKEAKRDSCDVTGPTATIPKITSALVVRNTKDIATVKYDNPDILYKDANRIRDAYQELKCHPLSEFLEFRKAGKV